LTHSYITHSYITHSYMTHSYMTQSYATHSSMTHSQMQHSSMTHSQMQQALVLPLLHIRTYAHVHICLQSCLACRIYMCRLELCNVCIHTDISISKEICTHAHTHTHMSDIVSISKEISLYPKTPHHRLLVS